MRTAIQQHALELVIVPKFEGQSTVVVLRSAGTPERTFGWLMRFRRLRADYETEPTSSRDRILLAAIHRMVRRLAR